MNGDCFATFMKEAQMLGNELNARREFDLDVGAFLKEKGLLVEWESWREARREAKG